MEVKHQRICFLLSFCLRNIPGVTACHCNLQSYVRKIWSRSVKVTANYSLFPKSKNFSKLLIMLLIYRVGLVLCDPVLSWISITPVLIFSNLPEIVTKIQCLRKSENINETALCVTNSSKINTNHNEQEVSFEKDELLRCTVCKLYFLRWGITSRANTLLT